MYSRTFTDLNAWKAAHSFVCPVYRVCRNFLDYERYALVSQFQRAAVSVPANIAEGYAKLSRADKLRFYNISQGSLEECRYYIILAKDLSYIDDAIYQDMIQSLEDTSRLLNSYCSSIKENKAID